MERDLRTGNDIIIISYMLVDLKMNIGEFENEYDGDGITAPSEDDPMILSDQTAYQHQEHCVQWLNVGCVALMASCTKTAVKQREQELLSGIKANAVPACNAERKGRVRCRNACRCRWNANRNICLQRRNDISKTVTMTSTMTALC